MRRKTAAENESDLRILQREDAAYWVQVMDRLHRWQSRAMSRDARIQELMRRHEAGHENI